MPLKLDRRNRRLVVVIAAAAIVLFVVAALFLPQPSQVIAYPSSESAASGGALAAHDLLRASGYRIERWRLPPANLPPGANTVLVLAEPILAPLPLSPDYNPDRAGLHRFLASGGTILATGPFAAYLLPGTACEAVVPSSLRGRYAALLSAPGRLPAGISIQPECAWSLTDPGILPLFGSKRHAVAVRLLGGAGAVELWSSATPLTNAGISRSGNLELLLDALGPPPRRILWDEYFHGEAPNWAGYLGIGALPWALLPLSLLLLGAIWTYGRRLAPPAQPEAAGRQSTFEFTTAMGSLYERARDPGLALDIVRQAYRRRLGRMPPPPEATAPAASARAREAAALAEYRRLAASLADTAVAEEPTL